jgi:hypothetical protein
MGLSNQFPIPVYTLVNGQLVLAGQILQNDAGQLIITPSGAFLHYDANGNPQLYDTGAQRWRSVQLVNGTLNVIN